MTIYEAIKKCQEEDEITSCSECSWQNKPKRCHYWLSQFITPEECNCCIEYREDNKRLLECGEILFCPVCGRGL